MRCFSGAAAGFLFVMSLLITTTAAWPRVTVDRGSQVALVQVTDEEADIGCHGEYVRHDCVEFDVFLLSNPCLTRDCSEVHKDIFVRVISSD